MTQNEMLINRLISLANEVAKDKRNARHAKVEADILIGAGELAFKESCHQRFQKKKPNVPYFDRRIKGAATEVTEVTVELKTNGVAKKGSVKL